MMKFVFPSETHAASHLTLRGSHSNGLVHGADGRERGLFAVMCFSSPKKRFVFILQKSLRTMAQPERVNNILHSALAAKDDALAAEAFESTGMHVYVCVCVFCLLLSASVTVRAGVGCSRCFTLLSVWCVQK